MRLFVAPVCFFCAAIAPLAAQTGSSLYAFWTVAGRAGVTGSTDGAAADARFNRPWAVAVDGQGNVYVAEAINHVVRKISPGGAVTTLAGRAGEIGTTDGVGPSARFGATGSSPLSSMVASPIGPFGLAVDGGSLFVADGNSHVLRRISASGVVSTFSGAPGNADHLDGPVSTARFRNPTGVAVDATGNIFVADTFSHVVRRISTGGLVTTIAGLPGSAGAADGIGTAARFLHPVAIAVSSSGRVYVADSANTVRRLTPGAGGVWTVTTIAGAAFTSGTTDGAGTEARFGSSPTIFSSGVTVSFPSFGPAISSPAFVGASYKLGDLPGLAVDAMENVYVCDFSNNTIRKISAGGVVTTIGGALASGSADGLGTAARFQRPCGIAVDAAGTLYIADSFNHTIRKGAVASAPVIEAQTGNQTVTAGANVTFSVTATGSPPPAIRWSRNGSPITGATNSTLVLTNVPVTEAGTYTATLTNAVGSTFTLPAVLTVFGAPVITTHPAGASLRGGESVTLQVVATGFPAPTFQWLRGGVPLPGLTNSTLALVNAQEFTAANYSVIVSNSLGSTSSNVAIVSVDTGRIVNLSVRSALAGSSPLIAGFVVAGGVKQLFVRAVGPGLRPFGVAGAMSDPQLTLQVDGTVISSNDNWSTAPNAAVLAQVAERVGGVCVCARQSRFGRARAGAGQRRDGRDVGPRRRGRCRPARTLRRRRGDDCPPRERVGAGPGRSRRGRALGRVQPRRQYAPPAADPRDRADARLVRSDGHPFRSAAGDRRGRVHRAAGG